MNTMKNKTNSVLKEVLERVDPPKKDLDVIENSLKDFLKKLEKKTKSYAKVFVGGSFAKKTLIKKDVYDIDIFIRFDKKYKDKNISNLTYNILKKIAKIQTMKGSRDYFRIKIGPSFFLEIVPVIEVRNPKEAENITDLSYSHVNYIRRKIKSKKILDDIKIAKAFCYANKCYGAESYINGFSGYGLELLIYHYKSFMKFIRAMLKIKEKEVIDIEKHHKNKQHVMMDINTAKLQSPIILIDPTYKQRNVLAALSEETFREFQKVCKKFLKNPSIKSFEVQKTDIGKVKRDAKRRKLDFVLIEAKTKKQAGDVAATKLLKFYKHLHSETSGYFDIKNKGFEYNGKKSAQFFFVVKKKKDVLISGPHLIQKKHIAAFKKRHKNIFVKNKRLYVKERVKVGLKKFIENWKKKNAKKIRDMWVSGVKII